MSGNFSDHPTGSKWIDSMGNEQQDINWEDQYPTTNDGDNCAVINNSTFQ